LTNECKLDKLKKKPRWRNWQTRTTQNRVKATSWEFNSPPRHYIIKRVESLSAAARGGVAEFFSRKISVTNSPPRHKFITMKYFILTYGCQANYADSERITRKLNDAGHKKTDKIEKADLIVVNACSVRQSAMHRVYAKINKYSAQGRSASGGKKIILAGCVLAADKKKLKNKVSKIWHPDEYFDLMPVYSSPHSAYVPIMTGCNNFCSYCAVPYTRGREKSRPAKEIIQEVKKLVKNKYKEIWLLGQNVNSYKSEIRNPKFETNSKLQIQNSKRLNFAELLRTINNIPGDFQIKFLTSHPKDIFDELIKTIAYCKKISKEIHLPMQSGDNTILKKMNRKYTIGYYKNLIRKIRKYIPRAKISTDIIVGFPAETKKQFENTAKAVKELKFSKAYIACYSPRPGTLAAKLADNIPRQEKKERRKILVKILEKQNAQK
jgi:tRNA-2-methylthio-N6-dimethylallyladenosine synthase